jgi:thiol-disulfide isomerase/thioredoxin
MSRRAVPVVAALAALLFAVAGCSSAGGGKEFQFTSATALGSLVPVNDRKPAENISGPLLGGGSTSLHANRGKVVLINFWAAWCPPCKVETPQLDLLYRQLRGKGVQFLGIDTKDVRTNARYFVATNHVTYPMIYDQQGESALKLGNIPASLPFTVLVDKQGRVAAVYLGKLTAKDLQGPLDRLRAET